MQPGYGPQTGLATGRSRRYRLRTMAERGARREGILVVAGEPSGDRAAAAAIRCLDPSATRGAFGIGGDDLARAGLDLVAHTRDLTALGLGETASRAGAWARAWAELRIRAARARPRVALLVDCPEINLPLARALRADGLEVVLYVGPQVWAWRRRRLRLLAARADAVALVLPFEKPLYDAAGVRAELVGHPVCDDPPAAPAGEIRRRLGIGPSEPAVAMLPGSRPGEVAALGPRMIRAARLIANRGIRSILAPAPGAAEARAIAAARSAGCAVPDAGIRARDVLGACDAAIVASGTATLEAALEGAPMAVVYRLGRLSWLAARRMVRVSHVGLPNLVAGRRIVPELLQDDATAAAIAAECLRLLDPAERERQRAALTEVKGRLGGPGAARRVARLVEERL